MEGDDGHTTGGIIIMPLGHSLMIVSHFHVMSILSQYLNFSFCSLLTATGPSTLRLHGPDPRIEQTKLKKVAGIPLQAPTVDNWRQIQTFKAKPDDFFICTYLKSGNLVE